MMTQSQVDDFAPDARTVEIAGELLAQLPADERPSRYVLEGVASLATVLELMVSGGAAPAKVEGLSQVSGALRRRLEELDCPIEKTSVAAILDSAAALATQANTPGTSVPLATLHLLAEVGESTRAIERYGCSPFAAARHLANTSLLAGQLDQMVGSLGLLASSILRDAQDVADALLFTMPPCGHA